MLYSSWGLFFLLIGKSEHSKLSSWKRFPPGWHTTTQSECKRRDVWRVRKDWERHITPGNLKFIGESLFHQSTEPWRWASYAWFHNGAQIQHSVCKAWFQIIRSTGWHTPQSSTAPSALCLREATETGSASEMDQDNFALWTTCLSTEPWVSSNLGCWNGYLGTQHQAMTMWAGRWCTQPTQTQGITEHTGKWGTIPIQCEMVRMAEITVTITGATESRAEKPWSWAYLTTGLWTVDQLWEQWG